MKINATNFNAKDVRISLQYENEAERHQWEYLKLMFRAADVAAIECGGWDDDGGRPSLTIVAKLASKVNEFGMDL